MWNRLYCNITANQASAAAIQIGGGITQYSQSEVRVRITKYSKVRVTKYRSIFKYVFDMQFISKYIEIIKYKY